MSKVTASTDIDSVKEGEVPRFTALALTDIVRQINGGLDFQTNFNCKIVSVTFSNSNVDLPVNHGLGRAPAGYIVSRMSAPSAIYDGSAAANASVIYLKAAFAVTVTLIFY